MGTFNVTIEIGDPQGSRFEEIEALADVGATLTTVPAAILQRLGVRPARRGTFVLANGERRQMDIGETRVRVEGIETNTVVLFGEEGWSPLLGAMTLEGLLLGVDPFNKRLIPVEGMLMASFDRLTTSGSSRVHHEAAQGEHRGRTPRWGSESKGGDVLLAATQTSPTTIPS